MMPMHLTNPIGVLDHFEPCSARAILLIVKPSPRVYKCLYNKKLLYVHTYYIIYISLSLFPSIYSSTAYLSQAQNWSYLDSDQRFKAKTKISTIIRLKIESRSKSLS